MAINLNDRYPGETNRPDENYPYGSFRDRTTPTSKDGTKLQQDWANDLFSFQWRLLEEAGMTPDGTVDTVGKSQYFDALIEVIKQNSQNLTVSQEIDGTSTTSVASENALGNVYRATVNKSGDTMTGDLSIRNNLPSLTLRNATIPANNRGAKVTLFNNAGRGTFSTSNENGTNEIRHTLPVRGGELALGNTASGAQNGWLRDENTGIIMQWGYVSGGNSTTVRFLVNMTQLYSLQLTHAPYGTQSRSYVVHRANGNEFNFSTDNKVNVRTMWFAIGK